MADRRKPQTADDDFVPLTQYQKWLWPVLRRRGWSMADLARAIGKDYNYMWKLAKGDPSSNEGRNNIQTRPGFDVAQAIGVQLGDVIGSLEAAGYKVGDILGGKVISISTPSGQTVQVVVPAEYTEAMQRDLTLSVESALIAVTQRN